MQVLLFEQANRITKSTPSVPSCTEDCIVLFFGNADVQESAGTFLGVEQINILSQREDHIQSLGLGWPWLWLQSDAQGIVGLIKIRGSLSQTNLLGSNVSSGSRGVDKGIWKSSPGHRSSSICGHHNICIQPLDPSSMLLLIWQRTMLMDADVLVVGCLLRFLQKPLFLRCTSYWSKHAFLSFLCGSVYTRSESAKWRGFHWLHAENLSLNTKASLDFSNWNVPRMEPHFLTCKGRLDVGAQHVHHRVLESDDLVPGASAVSLSCNCAKLLRPNYGQ